MASNTPVYWVGQDNNLYVKSPETDQSGTWTTGNFGPASNYALTGSTYAPVGSPSATANATRISDPALGGSVQGESTTAAGPSTAQAQANIQDAIDRLPGQQQSGYNSIDASYQDALNQLLLGKNQAGAAYGDSKTQTGKDYIAAKNTIGANAGSTLSGLFRLLGSRGAGGSSAYSVAAPQAVARAATGQRQDAGNTFGANNQALDTNWNNYLTGYNNQVTSAGSQKDQQRQSLDQNIATNKASLLQTLAGLQSSSGQAQPYLDQANSLLDSLANYSSAPINYQTQAYSAPSLSSYTSTPTTPTYQGQSQSNDYFSPYLGALLGKKQPLAA